MDKYQDYLVTAKFDISFYSTIKILNSAVVLYPIRQHTGLEGSSPGVKLRRALS
jgi:hypothetical protein